MIGVVVVAHGRLADELVAAAEHVVGRQPNTAALGVGANDDMEEARAALRAIVDAVDTGRGVIIATDMFGGTPANLAISLLERDQVEVVAGVNLPMLVTLAETGVRADLAEAARLAVEAGRKYLSLASRPPESLTTHNGASATAAANVTIVNARGLHARAAAKFIATAQEHEAAVFVERNGISVAADSIMEVLMLAAPKGAQIAITAEGPDAKSAVEALVTLVESGFGEP